METQIAERIAALTLQEKVSVLTGATGFALRALPQLGLRRVVMSDGPVGVRGETWEERNTSTNLPSPTAMAASWDPVLVQRLGQLLAAECRRMGVDVLLAPTVNLHRSPLGGRHFECFSEDPWLTAAIGGAYVRGLQENGVAACVKHFVANDTETERMSYDARIDERTLREVYLAPFEHIVSDAGVWSVMAAYNKVDGITMTESPLLADVLVGEWGFDGVVVSDWTATRSTVDSANAALDLVMPGPVGPWGQALVEAVQAGQVTEDKIDEKVRRVFRLASRVGALDDRTPMGPPDAGPAVAQPPAFESSELAAVAREAAATGFVLARNENDLLPLRPDDLGSVAVIGPNAADARTQGGGSATVFPPYVTSPLQGLRDALGDRVSVEYALGTRGSDRMAPLDSAVEVRFLDGAGQQLGSETRNSGRLFWLSGFGEGVAAQDVAAIEATGTIDAPTDGEYVIGLAGVGRYTVQVGEQVLLSETIELPSGADPFEGVVRPPHRTARVTLTAGQRVPLRVRCEAPGELPAFSFGYEAPGLPAEEELLHAVEVAARADVAVVVVGTTAEIESEGFDRTDLALPGRQDELVDRVRRANPRTVVVVNAGAPVELPWAEDVPAVLLSWFGGQEYGNALADVLLGVTEPGGRLPTTWPKTAADCPVLRTQPTGGVLDYSESLHVGYRGWLREEREPRYAFGHGLGYTTWDLKAIAADPTVAGVLDSGLRVTVRNSGDRPGRTVVQAYASRPGSTIERPIRWLVGFAVVRADAGETVQVEVPLHSRAFQHWDDSTHSWRTEPGEFMIAVGWSAANLGPEVTLTA